MISRTWTVFWKVIKTEGPWGVITRLAFTYSRIHRFTVMHLPLDSELIEPVIPDGISLMEASLSEVAELRRRREDLPEYFFRDESEVLDRCWVGTKDGIIGFICWVTYSGSSQMIELGPTDAELAYIYSMPDFRGKNLTTQAVLTVANALKADGFKNLWAIPNTLNPPILRSFEKCGLRQVLTIRRYGPLRWPPTPVDLGPYRAH